MPRLRTPREAAANTVAEHLRITRAEATADDLDAWADQYARTAGRLRKLARERRAAEVMPKKAAGGKR